MNHAETIGLLSVLGAPVLTFLGVVIGAWKGRQDGKRQSEDARRDLEVKARMASEAAANQARHEVTAAWESYAASMQVDRRMLLDRLEAVEKRATASERRLDSAETRAVIAEERASRWESLYRIAVQHLRQVISWANDNTGEMPVAPAELQGHL